MGRQPWTVVGLFKTEESVSPSVSGGAVLTSLIIFTAVYGILAIIEVGLIIKFVKIGPPTEEEALASIERRTRGGGSAGGADGGDGDAAGEPGEKPMAFAY
jgi:cytochrome d ubiquinol oxidase subunit I